MSSTLAGYGLRPVNADGHYTQARRYDNGFSAAYVTTLYKYTPVAVNSSGQIILATAGSDFIGVFLGVTYFDSQGIPHTVDKWTGGTAFSTTQPIWVWVLDDPNQIYQIQCDTTLVQSNGGQVDITTATIGSGNDTTGLSSATANAGSLSTSGQKQLRIMNLAPSPAFVGVNAQADAYPEIQVKIAMHQYVYNKVAV